MISSPCCVLRASSVKECKKVVHLTCINILLVIAVSPLPVILDAGLSNITCSENNYTVSGDTVSLSESLAVGSIVTCVGHYTLTTTDIGNLERVTTTTVSAWDGHSYGLEESFTETVQLSQVNGQAVNLV